MSLALKSYEAGKQQEYCLVLSSNQKHTNHWNTCYEFIKEAHWKVKVDSFIFIYVNMLVCKCYFHLLLSELQYASFI